MGTDMSRYIGGGGSVKGCDQKQMIMLEALNVLEKRVRRELENIELYLKKEKEALGSVGKHQEDDGADVCGEARERIKTIDALKKEVLSRW